MLLCQSPGMGKAEQTQCVYTLQQDVPYSAAARSPQPGTCDVLDFPFIPAGAKAGSGIYLPSLFLEKIKTTGHLVVLYCRPGLCHVVLPQPHLFSFLITSEPKQLTHAHAPCSPRESAPSLADHTLLQLVKLERSSSGWLGPWAAFQSPSHP